MDIKKFQNMKVVEDLTELVSPKIGDKFLTGTTMVGQIENKSVGDVVSYYEVTNINLKNGNITYATRMERLERQTMEER